MATRPTLASELRDLYAAESERIERDFATDANGRAAVLARTTLVESITVRLWREFISPNTEGPRNVALVALGGFGRRWLFPHSDIDFFSFTVAMTPNAISRTESAIFRRNSGTFG